MLSDREILNLANGSDVRGVAVEGVEDQPVTLTREAVNRIAGGFLKLLSERTGKAFEDLKVSIGYDSRISSSELKESAIDALSGRGVTVLDCGLASTPAMFMSVIFPALATDGAIMITASHLSYNRNGMKFFTKIGGAGHEDITLILENACQIEEIHERIGKVESFPLMEHYCNHLIKKVRRAFDGAEKPLEGMKIVVDAGNGAGGFFVEKVLQPLGADTEGSQFLEPDGMFPNHIPNPEKREAIIAIKKAVLENNADLGFVFDTDVDRMGAVLSSGEEITRNSFIALVAAIIAKEYPHCTIVTDSVTSDELTDFLEKVLGLHQFRYARGYRNVINKCIELNLAGVQAPLAIETSGHGALRENYYMDDGAYMAVKFIIAAAQAAKEGKTLESWIEKLRYPAESAEYRFEIKGEKNFRAYGNVVLEAFESRAIDEGIKIAKPSFEGVRLVFEDGWALLRVSLHDPTMPLNIESKSVGGVKRIFNIIKNLLRGFKSLDLTSPERL